jgi:galacturan 1,4-alpha-galacturonidase
MKVLVYLTAPLLFLVAWAAPQKRATCTVASAGDLAKDDVPNITNALQQCGSGGIIVFSAGKTYSIRSVLEFTSCSNCEVQIEGTLKVSDDTSYWAGKRAIFHLNGIKGATIHSKTGSRLIDGNGLAFWKSEIIIWLLMRPLELTLYLLARIRQ